MKTHILPGIGLVMLLAGNAYGANITIDYGRPVQQVNPRAFGIDITGYGNGKDITNDPAMLHTLANANLQAMRMDLKYQTPGDPDSPIVCGGAGCNTKASGDTWVSKIQEMGAEPVLRLHVDQSSLQLAVADAVSMVKHYTVNPPRGIKPVTYFIIGNESEGPPESQKLTYFNAIAPAMRTAAGNIPIKIGGAVPAYYNRSFLDAFIKTCGKNADFIDYHQYGEGGDKTASQSVLLNGGGSGGEVQQNGTASYEMEIVQLKRDIAQLSPGHPLDVEVGEWNVSWSKESAMATPFATVWDASVIGHIISAGGISLQYGDKVGLLGAISDSDSLGIPEDKPMPAYYAHMMFTGGKLFRHFGKTLVDARTTLNHVEVFASDNGKNIVVINKEPSTKAAAEFSLKGYMSGTAQVWQKNADMNVSAAPANLGDVTINGGAFAYELAPYSVTVFVLSEQGARSQ